ncbi:hypothetical protein [Streptomyces sp. GQFP]|uniref:hypothetical protein n=1 Tax=Streptomyces sp. GQFP TaxID=2907545 RepID=UPI001F339E7B|nr:hypothetical protein [Streptomyces sp. GQFP]UIX33402.1 hypothetical protein LUX31_27225 [Streptomyces sp. GQFP]
MPPPGPRSTSPTPNASRRRPEDALPPACVGGSFTVPADSEAADWRLAKYRQDVHYLHTSWLNAYRPIRNHNEGANGRLKSGTLDIGNPKHRPAHGQVAQTLLLAIMLTVANLRILETWLTDADYDATGPLPPLSTPANTPPTEGPWRHPPPHLR